MFKKDDSILDKKIYQYWNNNDETIQNMKISRVINYNKAICDHPYMDLILLSLKL
jgi:hypothetical protein